jgi:hypothetical protein
MSTIRLRATADADGEIHLRGLPIRKGEHAEIIVLTDDHTDETLLALLRDDPGWAWLLDPAEDVYTELREAPLLHNATASFQ